MKKLFKKFLVLLVSALTLFTVAAFCACGEKEPEGNKEPTYVEFNLMSYNIRTVGDTGTYSWNNRKANMVKYLKAMEADVITMQEVTTEQYEYLSTGLAEKYQIVHYEREGAGSEGLAIAFDKSKFELQSKSMFWLSETPDVMSKGWGASYYRICVNVLLKQKDTGIYLDVYNVHLDHQVKEARVNGINLILDRASENNYPKFIAGDFNDVANSECYQAIYEKMLDCQLLSDTADFGTTYHNWGAYGETAKESIDFCFVSEEIIPLTFKICRDKTEDGLYYSDHYGVKATVEIPQP